MVVYRQASGAIFKELQKSFSQQTYRAGQSFANARLLVIDGNSTQASEMSGVHAIDDALRAGVPVLLLNVTNQHTSEAAKGSPSIGAIIQGNHDGYLVTPRSHGIDIVHLGPVAAKRNQHDQRLDNDGLLSGTHEEHHDVFAPTAEHVQKFVSMLNDRVSGRLPTRSATDPPSSIPRYIVSATDAFTSQNGNVVPGQTVTTNVTFFFNVYYNDGGAGQQYQYLIVYAQGLTDPGTPANNSERTKGYFQTQAQVLVEPDPAGNGNLLTLVQQSPQLGSDFYQAVANALLQYDGGANGYYWFLDLPGSPQSIPGWNAFASTPPGANSAATLFYQTSPFDALDDNWHDGFTYVGGLVLDYYPKAMNPTSTSQFPINIGAVWRTQTTTTEGIQMLYGVGAQFEYFHAHEESPGIYDRDRTIVNYNPDPTAITLLFGRAS
jgi:hypothetical protein